MVVLKNLIQDVECDIRRTPESHDPTKSPETMKKSANGQDEIFHHDIETIKLLDSYNDPRSTDFAPTVFTTWDDAAIPDVLNKFVVKPYARVAMQIVRHPTDVVFLTHIILYLTVNLGSAVWLFHRFNYIHAVAHLANTGWCIGPFTLLMHNHVHNNGVLKKKWKCLDKVFPYLTEPLMGHTWNSYYYHHVKHHHVENNGMLRHCKCIG
jgi:hypothetical protein